MKREKKRDVGFPVIGAYSHQGAAGSILKNVLGRKMSDQASSSSEN